ncbi:hypothetical protein ELH97_02740 [Rhizobium leguminosarum]|nr:hypothetical protein ELI07_03055 [Rhizobium leguminosarum]TAX90918.1 hypothetical protein ELH97_02740 [Rhizobium leguminosarum]TAY10769.1 hypothetical protein ELH96_02870 [Rhizobium leguminosarum]TAY97489.1 hypothetical protein ELH79_02875 [Rhizobium leguminosarum]TAZ08258.1 hypothetical protein ELH78_02875 [Rhizobium leguminosarum]
MRCVVASQRPPPQPLPTRGRDLLRYRLAYLKCRKVGRRRNRLSPSPLWGGVWGGVFAPLIK